MGNIEIPRNLVAVFLGHQRPHVTRSATIADLDVGHLCLDCLHECVPYGFHSYDHRNGHASLARGTKTGIDGRIRNQLEISIRQNQHVILCPTQGLHALTGFGTRFVDIASNGSGTHEGNRFHIGVGQQGINSFFVTVDDVKDTIG